MKSLFEVYEHIKILRAKLGDPPVDLDWMSYYQSKYEIAKEFQPESILEIGVRAGYCAYAMLAACPDAKYLGIDADEGTHGGKKEYYKHAEDALREFDAEIIIENSQQLDKFPEGFDLIHIDGDHSYDGCMNDIIKAVGSNFGKVIVVDDYHYIGDVQDACDAFDNELMFETRIVTDGHRGSFLILR